MWGFSSHNRQSLRPVGSPPSALNVGGLVHHGLEFALNGHSEPAAEVARQADIQAEENQAIYLEQVGCLWSPEEQERVAADKALAVGMVQNYCNYWRFGGTNRSTVEPYTVKATEVTFKVPIPNTAHHYAGTFDAILQDQQGRLWIMDHKTYSRPSPKEKQELLWQFRSYGWVASQLFPNDEIGGTIYNGLKKQLPTQPKPLKNGSLSKAKTTLSSTTALHYLAAIEANRLDPGDYKEEITLLIERDAKDNPFFTRYEMPRNLHTERSWLEAATNLVKKMADPGPLVPNFQWQGCSDCSFRRMCHAFERAERPPLELYVKDTYQTTANLELTPTTVSSVEDL